MNYFFEIIFLFTFSRINGFFKNIYGRKEHTTDKTRKFKLVMLIAFGKKNWEKRRIQQFHYGAFNYDSSKMFNLFGANIGFDFIGEFATAKALSKFSDRGYRGNTNKKQFQVI